jgi:hypothetical protein
VYIGGESFPSPIRLIFAPEAALIQGIDVYPAERLDGEGSFPVTIFTGHREIYDEMVRAWLGVVDRPLVPNIYYTSFDPLTTK